MAHRYGDVVTLAGLEKPAPKRTAKDMLDLLEAHYAPPPSKPAGGRLISEIQAPNSTRRADALYLPITTAGRGTIIGHEIKVNRSDVLAEIGDPHKADAWMRYCNRWWLVVSDPSLIAGLDIPPQWGVMAPPTRGRFMTIIEKAPVLTPDPGILSQAWGTIFARVAYADIADMNALQREMNNARDYKTKWEEARAEVRKLTAALGGDLGDMMGRRGNAHTVADIIAQVERLGGYGDDAPQGFRGKAWQLEPEHVARAILAAISLDDRRDLDGDIQVAINRAEKVARDLRNVLKAVHPEEES